MDIANDWMNAPHSTGVRYYIKFIFIQKNDLTN